MRPVVCTWATTGQTLYGRPTHMKLDITDDKAPLIIGLDLVKISRRSFKDHWSALEFKRPTDNHPRSLPAYIQNDDLLKPMAYVGNNVLITLAGSLPMTDQSVSVNVTTLVKIIHRYSHALRKEIIEILSGSDHNKLHLPNL